MPFAEDFKHRIFQLNEETFHNLSLEAFNYQYRECRIYHSYCEHLKKSPDTVHTVADIPFLPIAFFKEHEVKSGHWAPTHTFKSSGTTRTGHSNHFVKDLVHYDRVAKAIFTEQFGSLSNLQIYALLPSYQEQGNSSLIHMVDTFMKESAIGSGYLSEKEQKALYNNDDPKLLIGVSYALLDMLSQNPIVKNTLIMETGGMKGRRKEMTRAELHEHLKKGFQVDEIWSEYGMTELMSQAYGKNGYFRFPPWANVLIRDINDPFQTVSDGKSGGINIIDLANIDTCCFIETMDLGRKDGEQFEVLGRFDNSDIRGCNLMI